ncbi:MAG: SDR family oxidoreductase [Deltaproteobacteria bacterium]|nr:SDR family oxidoreductase [Deltaproteobacteria bacterium]
MTKTIFITGASTGLGFATAQLFASRDWKVIATLRNPDSKEGQALAALAGVTVLALDVTQPAQIAAAASEALALGPVDVVFNNAGYGLAGPFEGATDAQLTAQLDTNLLGTMRTTKAFIPAFRERGAGVFIATTSIGGLVTFPLNSVYHATKWALEGWSESLAYELAGFGIQVKTVAPGGISTDFAGRSLVLTQHPAYAALSSKVMAAFRDPERRKFGSTAAQIAETVWEAATDGKDQITYVAGQDAKATYAQRLAVGIEAFRKGVRAMFIGG